MAASEDRLPKTADRADVERTTERPVFTPYVDIYEDSEGLTLVADMPGVGPEHVDVRVEKDALMIRGAVPAFELEGGRAVYTEYKEGDYERSFSLSQSVDTERIDATMTNGVLTVRLPKIDRARERKIEVKTG